jgi:hypothetical protein
MSNNIKKENVWVFIMAGQSNMAGRGAVEPEDTVPDKRILSINKDGGSSSPKNHYIFMNPKEQVLIAGFHLQKLFLKKFLTLFPY